MDELVQAAVQSEVTRLPLWERVEEKLMAIPIKYGDRITKEWLETELRCSRTSSQFTWQIIALRHALKRKGFYLTERGEKGQAYRVQAKEQNCLEAQRKNRADLRSRASMLVLLAATPKDEMTTDDRARHEKIERDLSMRFLFLKNAQKLVATNAAALLK